MKRFTLLFLVVWLALPSVASAQDLTETYSDEQVGFAYPAGWTVVLDDDGNPVLSNLPVQETSLLTPEPGIVKLSFSGPNSEGPQAELVDIDQDEKALFITGYYAGAMTTAYQIVASLAASFSGQTAEPKTTGTQLAECTH